MFRFIFCLLASSEAFQCLFISDIHLDLKFQANTYYTCDNCHLGPIACRNFTVCTKEPCLKSTKYGALRNCDLPLLTLKESVKWMQRFDVTCVVLLGDLVNHKVVAQTPEENFQEMMVTYDLLRSAFPNAHFIPVLGNHDSFFVNTQRPGGIWQREVSGKLLEMVQVKDQEKFRQHLFYQTSFSGVDIFVLNSLYYSNRNIYALYDDPGSQMVWLENALKQSNASVKWVFAHIPAYSGDVKDQFPLDLERLAHTYNISFMAFGHEHIDGFSLLPNFAGVAHVVPSLQPDNRNPSFRVYDFTDIGTVLDYTQYELDMPKQMKSDTFIGFHRSYSMKQEYDMRDLSLESYLDLVIRMETNNTVFETYKQHYNKNDSRAVILCDVANFDKINNAACLKTAENPSDNK